jgi:hypothetical protein
MEHPNPDHGGVESLRKDGKVRKEKKGWLARTSHLWMDMRERKCQCLTERFRCLALPSEDIDADDPATYVAESE